MSEHPQLKHFEEVLKNHEKGIAIGAGVIAATALVAGGAYAWHEHSVSKHQMDSKTRLHIHLHNGTDLLAKHGGGVSDPFVVMVIGKATIKSNIVDGTCSPTWDQKFEVGIIRGTDDSMHIECLDKETFVNHTLGHSQIDLREIGSEPQKISVHLKGGHENNGKIHLTLHISE